MHATRLLKLVFLLAAMVVPVGVKAQTTPQQPAMTTLAKTDFFIEIWQQNGTWQRVSDFEVEHFFNGARCECKTPIRVRVGFTSAGLAKKATILKGNMKVLVGEAGCVSTATVDRNAARCVQLGSNIKLLDLKYSVRTDIDTTVDQFFKTGCQNIKLMDNIRLFIDGNEDDIPDLDATGTYSIPLQLDSRPPDAPANIAITGGNEALEVSWDSLTGLDDFLGYLVFCSRGENLAVFEQSRYSNQYFTQATLCPGTASNAAVATDTANPRPTQTTSNATGIGVRTFAQTDDSTLQQAVGPFAAPAHFNTLQPQYLCSGLLTTQTTTRVGGLQNGIPYLVGVASVDKHGNASPVTEVYLQTPIPTRDFYRGYRAAGGQAEGGCSMAPSGSRGALAWVLALGAATLLGRRRRSRLARGRSRR